MKRESIDAPTNDGVRRIRVLYIAGWSRSGSTILGNLLAECDGVTHVGELAYFWERGILEDRLCGCGAPFSRCETWQAILARAQEGRAAVDPHAMVKLDRKLTRTRHLIPISAGLISRARPTQLAEYLCELGSVYRAISEVCPPGIIIDSSKTPSYALLLSQLPWIDLQVLHLIRDPRGTGFSWLKKKYDPGQARQMSRNNLVKNGVYWTIWNAAIEKSWSRKGPTKYFRLRYEDFAENPRDTVQEILRRFWRYDPVAYIDPNSSASLSLHHTVSGNPVRIKSGRILIRKDQEWTEKMALAQVVLTTTLTWPLLMRYGYPILPQSAR